MGSTTATYKIRYPAPADPANLQQDMANLAADVDSFVASIPVGASMEWDYGSAQIPSWALLQYGQAVSRTTYPRLHALASAATYPHGNGDGSSTFNIADKRGRVSAGKDNMGGTAAGRITAALSGDGTVLGAAVGAEGVALSTASMPSHSHGGATGLISSDHGHSADSWGRNAVHNHADPGHGHNPAVGGLQNGEGWMGWGSGWYSGGNGAPFGPHSWSDGQLYYNNTGNMSSGTESADHVHGTWTGGIDTNHAHQIFADGGGGAHLNTQPTIIAHKVVRAL